MRTAQALGLFVLLTAVMTWPQARVAATEATPHQDVFFNMWRLEWFGHALRTQPAHLGVEGAKLQFDSHARTARSARSTGARLSYSRTRRSASAG